MRLKIAQLRRSLPLILMVLSVIGESYGQYLPSSVNFYQQAPNKQHYMLDTEVDSGGNAFLYGRARDTLSLPIGMVAKISWAGVQEWAYEFQQVGETGDMDIDGHGNVYVGTTDYDTTTGGTRSDYRLLKLTTNGSIDWSKSLSGNGPNSFDRASAICVDNDGNVIITGFSEQPDYRVHWLTAKYDSAGTLLWSQLHATPHDNSGTAVGSIDIICDESGDLYVTGESRDTINGNFLTIKYSKNGTELWQRREGGLFFSQGRVARISAGKVYVAGHYTHGNLQTGTDSTDVVVASYDTAGAVLWSTIFNAPDTTPPIFNGRETIEDLQVDALGNVYVTGTQFAGNGISDDFMVLKLDPSGSMVWHRSYNAGTGWDDPRSLFLDANGNVFVTGRSEGAPTAPSVLTTIKYDLNGNQIWVAQYATALNDRYWPGEIRWTGGSSFYVGASRNGFGGSGHLILLRYSMATGVEEVVQLNKIRLFPNPTRYVLNLSSAEGAGQVVITDAMGRQVLKTTYDSGQPIDIGMLAPGCYLLYTLDALGNKIDQAQWVKE